MSDDLAEEYDRLIRPEIYREMDAAWKASIAGQSFPGTGEMQRAWRAKVKTHLSAYDPAILRAAGMTVDDLVAAREARVSKRHSGKLLPRGADRVEQRRTALQAIRNADLQGLGWSETIEAAQAATRQAHDQEHDRKTLDSWLRTLHTWGLLSVAPPASRGRGRPRKKE